MTSSGVFVHICFPNFPREIPGYPRSVHGDYLALVIHDQAKYSIGYRLGSLSDVRGRVLVDRSEVYYGVRHFYIVQYAWSLSLAMQVMLKAREDIETNAKRQPWQTLPWDRVRYLPVRL